MERSHTKFSKGIHIREDTRIHKYMDLILGDRSWLKLIKFELIMLLFSRIPGALGLFLRSHVYKFILGRVGKGTFFGANIVFRHPEKIFIGENVIIDDNCMIDAKGINNRIDLKDNVFLGRNSILSCKDGSISIKEKVTIGFNCEIFSSGVVEVGESTLIAAYSYLVGGGNYDIDHTDVPFSDQEGLQNTKGIIISRNCWIGAHANILDGVSIGEGSVIGAGAVVRDDIPEFSIAAGMPAKVIRKRLIKS